MKNWKRTVCLLVGACLLSGCSLLDGEYTSVTRHISSDTTQTVPVTVMRAATYNGIRQALEDMVAGGKEQSVIRISSYDGEDTVEEAVNRACMEVANDTPLGAWGVYYISSSVNRIIAYYDAEITITYKKSALEIESLGSIHSKAGLEGELRYLMSSYSSGEALYLPASLTEDWDLTALAQQLYYNTPSLAAALPQITAAIYPETGDERIAEFTLTWPYTAARLTDMQEKVEDAADELVASVSDMTPTDGLYQLCRVLADSAEYDTEWETGGSTDFSRSDTAFGALIDGKATGEGFAMAVCQLCDRLGLDSMVVQGRKDSVDHCWNLVLIDDSWYHLDASLFVGGTPGFFLCLDEDMTSAYWWDTSAYPATRVSVEMVQPAEEAPVEEEPPEAPPVLTE